MTSLQNTSPEALDQADALRSFRAEFLFPKQSDGGDCLYFAGNSLGLQPKKTARYIEEELEDWAKLGVEGHLHSRRPWLPYHEFVTESLARLVGAKPEEIVAMNTLSVNLHLMLVSFYRPTEKRFKILIEKGAFPSDQYAVASQARFHGFDPKRAVLELEPRAGEDCLRPEDILERIRREGDEIALVLLGDVNYLTGQAFDIRGITQVAHAKGCRVGFDLAHAAGNLKLDLHSDGPDFAVWCSYKYLNAGPGAIAGAFVHERHLGKTDLPRFEGWWGTAKKTRFQMKPEFEAIPTAEAWQLSNPPIFQLAALRASLDVFDRATMPALRAKSETLTSYLESLLDQNLGESRCSIITPRDPKQRGAHLSVRFKQEPKRIQTELVNRGVVCDFREPDVIRFAPVPLYNSFTDVSRLVTLLKEVLPK